MPGRACSLLAWSQGKGALFSSPPDREQGRGFTKTPLAFLPLGLGLTTTLAHGQQQPLPSLAFPRLQMLLRKALAWSQQDALELAVGTGVLDSTMGVTKGTRGCLYQWQYLVVVGEFLTGRDT